MFIKKLTIAMIILSFISCQKEVNVTNHSGIKNKTFIEKSVETITKKIQYQYELATFKNDSITYWWVLFKHTNGQVWSIIKQDHSYFSPKEVKDHIINKGYKKPFLINFIQVSEATYLSEGYEK